jgi:hypothetical protein
MLLDMMDVLRQIFQRYPSDENIARGIAMLLESIAAYGESWCVSYVVDGLFINLCR